VKIDEDLAAVAAFTEADQFADVRKHVDPKWVREALEATGTATVRRRRLPAEQVVWLVIGMAMFRNWPIHDLVGRLKLVLPGRTKTVVPSTVAEARVKVGAEPLERLFEMCAQKWAHASARRYAWRGLAMYGVDGSTLRVADSTQNRAHFGGAEGRSGDSGYPLVRLAALMAVRSHLLAAASFGRFEDSEIVLTSSLWREVPDNSLVLVDRNFLAAGILVPLVRDGRNRHWMTRAKSTTKWTVLESIAPGDDLIELQISAEARSMDPSLPKTYVARAIKYQRKGFKPQTVLTSLTDAKEYPAKEVVARYHERWELELGYDEIKTKMLDRQETIRSRTVDGVGQELWGILLAYNLIRLEMERTADDLGVEPTQISFVSAMRLICDTWVWCSIASAGAIPTRLKTMREFFTRLVLPARRSNRSYPRAVKIKMSNYARKRPLPRARA
jgi:Insertion element 4 transposase N-terminal/Transposase DDE domain